MVSHAGRGRGAGHPVGKCWFVIRSIPCGVTCSGVAKVGPAGPVPPPKAGEFAVKTMHKQLHTRH